MIELMADCASLRNVCVWLASRSYKLRVGDGEWCCRQVKDWRSTVVKTLT